MFLLICLISILIFLERTGEEGRRQFLQEIELMKEIGTHRNVMSMLGYWVKSGPIMLILEYVPHGDLLQWLRNKRHQVRVDLNFVLKISIVLPYLVVICVLKQRQDWGVGRGKGVLCRCCAAMKCQFSSYRTNYVMD